VSAPLDPFLQGLLEEAGITGDPQHALTQVFPTMDDLYASTADDREEIIGENANHELWLVQLRRWRQADTGTGRPVPTLEELEGMVADAGALGSEASLYQSLLIRMAADRRAGEDS
jgi:hypothetical protein